MLGNGDGTFQPAVNTNPTFNVVIIYLGDFNRDGKLDPGDPTATTDTSGSYTFTGLHPGTYTVRQVLPDGYAATAPRGYSETVRLGAGENAAGPSFGDVRISSVTLGFDYLLLIARNYGQAGTFADGDLNGDGIVNFADLLILTENYGKPGTLAQRDFNGHGAAHFNDSLILSQNYGASGGTVASSGRSIRRRR